MPYIDWNQCTTRFIKGDLVYIYSTSPVCAIKFLTEVIAINITTKDCLDDKDFWIESKDYDNRLKCKKFVRLKLKEIYKENLVTRVMLEEHGLKARIQHAIKLYDNNGNIKKFGEFIHQKLGSKTKCVYEKSECELNEKVIMNELVNNVLITTKPGWARKRETRATLVLSKAGQEIPNVKDKWR